MARVFVTGAKGQVGSELEYALLKAGHQVVSSSHQSLDISQYDNVRSALQASGVDIVVNTAAFTNVERAESEKAVAYSVNALGARNLATCCAQLDIPLIHLSTDYVFAVDKEGPHKEDDATEGRSVYAKSKLEGEHFVLDSGCKALIIRTSWLFGRFGRNFVKIMLSLARERHEIAVVSDQLGNPTPVRALAEAIVKIIPQVLKPTFKDFGLYHFSGFEATSWDDFAREIFRQAQQQHVINHEITVVSISSDEYKSKAMRPHDSRLNCDKFKRTFGITMPYWPQYLAEVIRAYQRESKGQLPLDGYDHTLTAFVTDEHGKLQPAPDITTLDLQAGTSGSESADSADSAEAEANDRDAEASADAAASEQKSAESAEPESTEDKA